MAREIVYRFRVTDQGTLQVLDQAEQKFVAVERKTKELGGELDRGSRSFAGFRSSADLAGAVLTRVRVAASGALIGLGAMVRSSINSTDELTKLARASGLAVDELSSLRTAARLSGIEMSELGQGFGLLSRRMRDAASGNGEASRTFRALGVDVTDINGKLRRNVDVLTDVAEVFSLLPDGPEKTAAAMDLFGRSGARFISLLNSGADGIKQLREENERLGLTFDETFGRKAEQVNDNLARVRLGVEGLATTIAAQLLPSLAAASDGMLQMLGLIDSARPAGRIGELIETQQRIRTDSVFAERYLTERHPQRAAVNPTPALRQAAIDEIEREIENLRAGAEIAAAVRGVRSRIGADTSATSKVDTEAVLTALAGGKASGSASDGTTTAGKVRALKEETEGLDRAVESLARRYGESVQPIRDFSAGVEDQTRTISVSLGESFRRLTTGGGGFGFLDGMKNAFQAASADAFDAVFAEKLKFDVGIEQNFVRDLPGMFADGMTSVVGIFRDSTDEMRAQADTSAQRMARSFGAGFTDIATNGQALSAQLAGLGIPVVGGTPIPAVLTSAGNLAGGRVGQVRGGRFAAVDAFGSRFTGSDLDGLLGAASGQVSEFDVIAEIERRNRNARNTGVAVTGAALVGAVADALVSRGRTFDTRFGTVELERPGFLGRNTGFAETTTTGAVLGASVGGAVGAVVGGALGALVGLISELTKSQKSAFRVTGETLQEVFNRDPTLIQQGGVTRTVGGKVERSGIEAPGIDITPSSRAPLFTEFGFPIVENRIAAQGGLLEQYLDRLFSAQPAPGSAAAEREAEFERINGLRPGAIARFRSKDPIGIQREVFGPSLAAGALIAGFGNAELTSAAANRITSNVLLSGIEFPEEGRRQIRKLVEAAGFDFLGGVEQLAVDFTKSGVQNRNNLPQDLFPEQFARLVAELAGVFDDLPKGVDATAAALRNVGETSVNTGALLKDLGREIEIFGGLAQGLDTGLKQSLGTGIFTGSRTPESVMAAGGPVHDIIRANRQRGVEFVSALQVSVRDSIGTAITEGLFDAVKATPAWDALTSQIAEAVAGRGTFAQIPDLMRDVIGASLPQIEAAQQAAGALLENFGVTPSSLFTQADDLRAFAKDARFGRLDPKLQAASLDREVARLTGRIEELRADGVQSNEVSELQRLFTDLANVGQRRSQLAGTLFDSSTVGGARRQESFFEQSLRLVDFAASGLSSLGVQQRDILTATESQTTATVALTESNASLTDSIEDLREDVQQLASILRTGNYPEPVVAQALASLITRDAVATDKVSKAILLTR